MAGSDLHSENIFQVSGIPREKRLCGTLWRQGESEAGEEVAHDPERLMTECLGAAGWLKSKAAIRKTLSEGGDGLSDTRKTR